MGDGGHLIGRDHCSHTHQVRPTSDKCELGLRDSESDNGCKGVLILIGHPKPYGDSGSLLCNEPVVVGAIGLLTV